MIKKLIAILSAAIIVISSMSIIAFAADERDVIVVYPGFSGSRTATSGDGTPSGGGIFMFAGMTDTAATYGFADTDERIGKRTKSENNSGYTNFSPETLEANKGIIYKPCASDATGTSGWYDVYVERLLYYNTERAMDVPDSMHIDVVHRNGIAHYLMDMTPNDGYVNADKYEDLVKIGTFYFNNAASHQVRIFSPIIKEIGTNNVVRFDFGGAMFVPAEEPTEKSYFNPVFSDDFSDGIAPVWYETTENVQYQLSSQSVNIPAGDSFKINYAEAEDAAEAVKFTEGAINFKLWWRNQAKNDAYTSVILGKSQEQTAEFRIYSEKVMYAENGEEICEIPIHGNYALYYNAGESSDYHDQWKYTLSGYKDKTTGVSYYPHMMRIEITDPEALSESNTAITDNLKTVKVIVNYGTANAMVMAMGSLPENSILNNMEGDEPTDNYIEFKNVAGTAETENNAIDINNISIMVSDPDIKSKSVYASSVNRLKYTKSNNELSIYTGILGAEAEVSKPCEITNTLLKSSSNSGIAIMAPFYSSGRLADAPVVRDLNLMPGTKKKITMTIDTHTDDMDKVRFFIWDNFDDIVPAKEAESAVISN